MWRYHLTSSPWRAGVTGGAGVQILVGLFLRWTGSELRIGYFNDSTGFRTDSSFRIRTPLAGCDGSVNSASAIRHHVIRIAFAGASTGYAWAWRFPCGRSGWRWLWLFSWQAVRRRKIPRPRSASRSRSFATR